MKKNLQDQHPDYVLSRLEGRRRLADVLLVDGVFCAAVVGLLVLVPAIAAEPAPDVPPAIVVTHRVCTPAFALEDFDATKAAAKVDASSQSKPACATAARPKMLVRQDIRRTGSFE